MAETDWAGLIQQEDVEELWNALFRLVSRHPSTRPLRFATDEAAVTSEFEINADLTQELFLELFEKRRFEIYMSEGYESSDIEKELTHIELPNMVGARLRKRYPESFRLARRVSALLKSSSAFRKLGERDGNGDRTKKKAGRSSRKTAYGGGRSQSAAPRLQGCDAGRPAADDDGPRSNSEFGVGDGVLLLDESLNGGARRAGGYPDEPTPSIIPLDIAVDSVGGADHDDVEEGLQSRGPEARRQRMVNQFYGLKKWAATKPVGDSGHFAELAKTVPVRKRDTRIVGRSGSSQLILSNPELEKLIIEILAAIDSPADVRTLRQLVLSKIPLQDYSVSSLDQEFDGQDGSGSGGGARSPRKNARSAVDRRETPEDELLGREHAHRVGQVAGEFLDKLRRAVNNNPQRYSRLIRTLWYCYFDPTTPNQIEIAKKLGVSDSLVSDNRRLIEHELRKLKLGIQDGTVFSETLSQLVATSPDLAVR